MPRTRERRAEGGVSGGVARTRSQCAISNVHHTVLQGANGHPLHACCLWARRILLIQNSNNRLLLFQSALCRVRLEQYERPSYEMKQLCEHRFGKPCPKCSGRVHRKFAYNISCNPKHHKYVFVYMQRVLRGFYVWSGARLGSFLQKEVRAAQC